MTLHENKFRFLFELEKRPITDLIVIHHTGSGYDADFSAADIHQMHIRQSYAGIGYHYVVRKSGLIETGRPIWAVGAHAYTYNKRSVGIHLSGDFNYAEPTFYQVEATAELIAYVARRYNLKINYAHIKGHRDLNATDCPGRTLYEMIPTLIGKAAWYYLRWKD